MKMSVVPIGNSRGIRIPKGILQQCHITSSVDLKVNGNAIILKPLEDKPRKCWEQFFETMHKNKDDQLLIDDNIGLKMKAWQW